jgi:hypothetical protein
VRYSADRQRWLRPGVDLSEASRYSGAAVNRDLPIPADSHSEPNAVAVVMALKITARVSVSTVFLSVLQDFVPSKAGL